MMTVKQCPKCEKYKPLTADYWQYANTKTGRFHSRCKVCDRAFDRHRDKIRNKRRALNLRVYGANHRARLHGADGVLTVNDIRRLYRVQLGACHYCKTALNNYGTIDHKHALSNGGSNTADNVALACRRCNSEKSNTPYIDYLAYRAARYGTVHEDLPDGVIVQHVLWTAV